VQHHANGDANDAPIMQGWRKSIAGSDLLALLEGRASVALDPATGAVRVTKRRGSDEH